MSGVTVLLAAACSGQLTSTDDSDHQENNQPEERAANQKHTNMMERQL